MNYGDEVTTRILQILAEKPRAPNKHIAMAAGISEATVASRIRTLQADGVIRVVLQRDWHQSSPSAMTAIAEFYVEQPGAIAEAIEAIAAFDEVFSVYETVRRPEIVANCSAESPQAFADLMKQMATKVPHLREMHSLPIISFGRYTTTLGTLRRYPEKTLRKSEEDDPLIALLQQDGRQSVSALARQLGLSVTATRYRVNKLLSQPGWRVGLVCDSEALGYTTWFDVRAKVRPAMLQNALDHFSDNSSVRVVAHLTGPSNLFLFLLARSLDEVDDFVSGELRNLPGLLDFSLMRVPSVFKYDYHFNL